MDSVFPSEASWSAGRGRDLAVVVMLIAVVGATYVGTLGNEFVYDDQVLIVQNELLKRLDSLPRLFISDWWRGTEEHLGLALPVEDPSDRGTKRYRPLVAASYALNAAIDGFDPRGFHLVNVVLHALVTVLFYFLARQLALSGGGAVLAAVLFAVHPLHTEAVAWAAGRPELFMSASVLGGLWLVMKGYRGWALLAFVCGLLSKEQAVVLPVLVLLHDRLFRPPFPRSQKSATLVRTVWHRYGGYAVITVAYLLLRFAIFGRTGADVYPVLENPLEHLKGTEWALSTVKMAGQYLWLALWPAALSVDYSYNAIPAATSLLDAGVLWGLAAWGGLFGLAVWAFNRDPRVAFAIGITVFTFAPASNVFVPLGTPLAERVFYLPLTGLCLLVGLGWERLSLWVKAHQKGGGAGRTVRVMAGMRVSPAIAVLAGLMFAVCLGLTIRTVMRIQDWKNNHTLFRSAVQVVPGNAKAHAILGDALRKQLPAGGNEQALAEYQAALALYPDYLNVSAHFATNYGHTLLDLNQTDEAVVAFEKAVAAKPRWSKLHYNLGLVYAKTGQYDKAQEQWNQALALNPVDPQIHNSLSRLAIERGRYEDAIAATDKALAEAPEFALALYNRAVALERLGRMEEATSTYERVLMSPSATEEFKHDVTQRLNALRVPKRPS